MFLFAERHWINSLRPSDAYISCVGNLDIIGSDNGSAPSHNLNQCNNIADWTLRNKIQWIFFLSKFIHFHSRKCIWKRRLRNGRPFVSASMCQHKRNAASPNPAFWLGVLTLLISQGYFKLTGIGWISFLRSMISRDKHHYPWWRHQMETFSALLALCAGNSPVPSEFPAHRPVTRSFDAFIDLRLNKRACKQSRG